MFDLCGAGAPAREPPPRNWLGWCYTAPLRSNVEVVTRYWRSFAPGISRAGARATYHCRSDAILSRRNTSSKDTLAD